MIAVERLDAFMARANAQYYATHDPFRDFTTSPEISQVFGELLGAWASVVWEAMGRPDEVILAELGPGRGTLMSDALRTIRAVAPGFAAALSVHLVETSPPLRARQAEKLEAQWHDAIDTLPRGPLIVLANEFLDALPVRQFVRRGGAWAERWVDEGRWVERPAPGFHAEGEWVEICEPGERLVADIAHRVAADGGAALFLDYGADQGGADTLQAIRAGGPADPLAAPGEADLTAHVDFGRLARVASPLAAVRGPVPQGKFLARLGLFQRTDRLARSQPPARAGAMIAAAQRLAEPMHMGRLFKAFAVTHPDLPVPPGFAE
jgi:SAM-dependent MidA family methyltransferase